MLCAASGIADTPIDGGAPGQAGFFQALIDPVEAPIFYRRLVVLITQGLHRAKNSFPERDALVYGNRSISYGELYDQVATCAGALRSEGAGPGDRIGILSVNCDRAIVWFYGAVWAGLIPNYLNNRWALFELTAAIDDCSASVLVVDDAFLEMGVQLAEKCASIRRLVYIGDASTLPDGVLHCRELMANASPVPEQSIESGAPAFLNYTGGTTGKGKGVIHSHGAHTIAMLITIAEGFFVKGKTCLAVPLFHIGGISVVSSSVMLGNTLVIVANFEPAKVLALIEEKRIESAFMVPTMLKMLVEHPNFSRCDSTSLKHIRYGGSPIDETLLMTLIEKMPWAGFMQIYGQTELVPASFLHECDHGPEGVKLGRTRSAGTPAYGVDVQIRDTDGHELGAGETGEIAIRGSQMMKGYWNNAEQTEAAVKEKWLMTGDAGYLDEEGYLYVVDRIKDMIVSGGENVYSTEVESAICRNPAVKACAVIGLPNETWGEVVHAEIVLKPGMGLSVSDLADSCRQYLAGYKLARSINFVDALPLTAVGKIDKVAIRDKYTS